MITHDHDDDDDHDQDDVVFNDDNVDESSASATTRPIWSGCKIQPGKKSLPLADSSRLTSSASLSFSYKYKYNWDNLWQAMMQLARIFSSSMWGFFKATKAVREPRLRSFEVLHPQS